MQQVTSRIQWTGENIGDEGAKKISESLMINTTLTQLNLRSGDKIQIDNKYEKIMKK